MKIEWKYAPSWAQEVRKEPRTGQLFWFGEQSTDEKSSYLTQCVGSERLPYLKFDPIDCDIVCERGDDVELTEHGLQHVYTIAGHKLYAESPEAANAIKTLLANQANAVADAEKSLRDEFAAAALTGLATHPETRWDTISLKAYHLADKMIQRRKNK